MSSLHVLRVSRLAFAGRQRVLGGVSSVVPSARRQFSWAPAAYRAPRKQSGARHKRRGGKKIARGRDGLWQELQQVYQTSTTKEEENSQESWKRRRDDYRQEQLSQAHQEFRALVHRYRNALFPHASSAHQTKGSILKLLQQLHSLCQEACQHSDDCNDDCNDDRKSGLVSMKRLKKTEQEFRDIGNLTKTLISLYARMVNEDNDAQVQQEKNSAMAENLLRGLIQLQQDRQLLFEQRAKQEHALQQQQQQQQDESKNKGLIGWIKGVFVPSKDDTDENQKETETSLPTVLAHEEASFGPTKRQYAQVIKSLKRDLYAQKWQVPDTVDSSTLDARIESSEAREAQLSIAIKMSALFDLHLQQGGAPSTSLTLPILQVYAQVGSLYAADEARRIYIGPCKRNIPQDGFHSVLRAYSLAALMEETHDARAKAATTAVSLLKDREEAYSGTSYNLPQGKDPRGESYALVLETLLRAGEKAVPDRVQQAEVLLKRYLGEKTFDQVVGNRKGTLSSKVDISVFESLVFLYEHAVKRHHTAKYLDMLKSIMESAQAQQDKAKRSKGTTPVDGEEQSVFPSTKSYNSLLSAMNSRVSVLYNDLKQRTNKDAKATNKSMRQEIQTHVDYAISILDRMTSSCPPDIGTFELLLDLLAKSDSPERQRQAQEIMSRMSIRQACTGISNNAWSDSSRVYSSLLRCWAVGPEASSSENLDRSLRILDKMEAESGIQHLLPGSNVSDAEQEIFDSVYAQNQMESYKNAYNGALQICSNCRKEPDAAFDAAFDIYNRMVAANVTPDPETFEYLFATCLLPVEDEEVLKRRRDLAGTVIAFASDHGMETKDMHKQLRSIIKSSKSKRARPARRKAKSIN